MGAFYTHAICSREDVGIIERYIQDSKRNAFIMYKEEDAKYAVVTEGRCDTQDIKESNLFYRPLSEITQQPLLACIVQDSDDLLLCLFSKGKDTYQLYDSPGYSAQGKLVVKNLPTLVEAYGGDVSEIKKIHTTKNARKHDFAEQFQEEVYSAIGVPFWPIGIGFTYLSQEKGLVEKLGEQGIIVKEIRQSTSPA